MPLNETHDPTAAQLGAVRQRARLRFPDPEPAVRRVPPLARRRRDASAWRSAMRSLDLALARRARAVRRRAERRAPRVPRVVAERADAPRTAMRGPPCGPRCSGWLRADGGGRSVHQHAIEPLLVPAVGRHDAAAGGDRRLHRFLRVGVPRDERRQHVPSRRAAAAQLQARADRVSRPRLVDRAERHTRAPAGRASEARRRVGAARVRDPPPRLRAGGRRVHRPRERARRRRSRSTRPSSTCSACAC